MQQTERIFRELCCVKKASPQRLRTTWFHLYNFLEMTQLQTWTDLWLPGWKREEGQLVGSGCGYPKGSIKDLCGDTLFCIQTVSNLVSWLWYRTIVLQDVTIWGNWGKDTWDHSALFLLPAWESTIISKGVILKSQCAE